MDVRYDSPLCDGDSGYFVSSFSVIMAIIRSLGVMHTFLFSLAVFPASSSTSKERNSSTVARYTGAPLPTRFEYRPSLRYRPMRATGNCSPALTDLVTRFFMRPFVAGWRFWVPTLRFENRRGAVFFFVDFVVVARIFLIRPVFALEVMVV